VAHESLRRGSNEEDTKLIYQVKRWLEDVSPDINIRVENLESSYKINYSFSRGKKNMHPRTVS